MRGVIAAIDCGTNTIKLLIGDTRDGALRVLERESEVVRLGEGTGASGRLSDAAIGRTFTVIDRYAELIDDHGVERIRFCATSATRDSNNAQVFSDGVHERLGVYPEVLTGEEEAALSYAGATAPLSDSLVHPTLVIDIGGGSTELVLGERDVSSAVSMNIGAVRLFERHLASDPPTQEQQDACVADIDAALAEVEVPVHTAKTVIGIAGTITTLAAGTLGLQTYDPEAIDGQELSAEAFIATCDELAQMSTGQRRELGYMHPGRADVIAAGALIARTVVAHTECATLMISEADILEGIAAEMASSR